MTDPYSRHFAIEYEPQFVERAVLVAIRDQPGEAEFRTRQDMLYAIPDPEERETRFRLHHAEWFDRLGFDEAIAAAIRDQPSVAAAAGRCVVVAAAAPREEGAELFVAPGRAGAVNRTVVLRLRPDALGNRDRLRAFLRHELGCVADMLDPRFGYGPPGSRPAGEAVPERLFRERYRVLWDILVDRRLVARGLAPPAVMAARRSEFQAAFPMFGTRANEAFDLFLAGPDRTHADLVAFAVEPTRLLGVAMRGAQPDGSHGAPRDRPGPREVSVEATTVIPPPPAGGEGLGVGGGLVGEKQPAPHAGEPCPLCRCPTHAFEPEPERLPGPVRERIREAFPLWAPADGLCRQCADLFAALAGPGSGRPASSRPYS